MLVKAGTGHQSFARGKEVHHGTPVEDVTQHPVAPDGLCPLDPLL